MASLSHAQKRPYEITETSLRVEDNSVLLNSITGCSIDRLNAVLVYSDSGDFAGRIGVGGELPDKWEDDLKPNAQISIGSVISVFVKSFLASGLFVSFFGSRWVDNILTTGMIMAAGGAVLITGLWMVIVRTVTAATFRPTEWDQSWLLSIQTHTGSLSIKDSDKETLIEYSNEITEAVQRDRRRTSGVSFSVSAKNANIAAGSKANAHQFIVGDVDDELSETIRYLAELLTEIESDASSLPLESEVAEDFELIGTAARDQTYVGVKGAARRIASYSERVMTGAAGSVVGSRAVELYPQIQNVCRRIVDLL